MHPNVISCHHNVPFVFHNQYHLHYYSQILNNWNFGKHSFHICWDNHGLILLHDTFPIPNRKFFPDFYQCGLLLFTILLAETTVSFKFSIIIIQGFTSYDYTLHLHGLIPYHFLVLNVQHSWCIIVCHYKSLLKIQNNAMLSL